MKNLIETIENNISEKNQALKAKIELSAKVESAKLAELKNLLPSIEKTLKSLKLEISGLSFSKSGLEQLWDETTEAVVNLEVIRLKANAFKVKQGGESNASTKANKLADALAYAIDKYVSVNMFTLESVKIRIKIII